jgi:hypothetical protein
VATTTTRASQAPRLVVIRNPGDRLRGLRIPGWDGRA